MKELKFFDRYQFIIGIVGIGALLTAITIFIPMFLTSEVQYDAEGVLETVTYNPILQAFYTIFMFTNMIAFVWFVVRAITFKMRKKEYDQES